MQRREEQGAVPLERPVGGGEPVSGIGEDAAVPAARATEAPPPGGSARAAAWIVGCALFLQSLDATIVAVALPTMARDFGAPVIELNTVITAYLLSATLFIPISGWMVDRFGSKRVFVAALALFTFASVLCALAPTLTALIAARALQGSAGAMLAPVGRVLIAQRNEKAELVRAMSSLGMWVVLGPVAGPPLGGFIVQYLSWPWLFYINLPIGLLAIWATARFITDVRGAAAPPVDVVGFVLAGAGLTGIVMGLTQAAAQAPLLLWLAPLLFGVMLVAGYVAHARIKPHPILDLGLLGQKTFAASVAGGVVLRLGVAASAFLLALMLQVAFGIDPLASGLIALSSAASALVMKLVAYRFIRAAGYRRLLILNTLALSALLMTWALFRIETPLILVVVALFSAGFARSLQFTTINTLIFSGLQGPKMSAASSLSSTAFQLAETIGVSGAAIVLSLAIAPGTMPHEQVGAYTLGFAILALAHLLPLPFFIRLPADAGAELRGR